MKPELRLCRKDKWVVYFHLPFLPLSSKAKKSKLNQLQ